MNIKSSWQEAIHKFYLPLRPTKLVFSTFISGPVVPRMQKQEFTAFNESPLNTRKFGNLLDLTFHFPYGHFYIAVIRWFTQFSISQPFLSNYDVWSVFAKIGAILEFLCKSKIYELHKSVEL